MFIVYNIRKYSEVRILTVERSSYTAVLEWASLGYTPSTVGKQVYSIRIAGFVAFAHLPEF
jgi:hypothetical protein